MSRINWAEYALELAKVASMRSEDPYRQVGACILRSDNTVASLGYNGAPSGINIDWSDREMRRSKVVHAEMNALRYIQPNECYLLATTLLPCTECIKNIAAYGIKKVVFNEVYPRDKEALFSSATYGIQLYASTDAMSRINKDDGRDLKYITDI
tara:strand:+ start:1576 stop:2037 length:462 start_codon:yes stop_codon:yes gene_type:complete